MPSVNVGKDVCDVCEYGKKKRLPFAIGKARSATKNTSENGQVFVV